MPSASIYIILLTGNTMASILIKDTTREQREQIIKDSLGDDWDVGCGYESTGIDYQLYIDGKKELDEIQKIIIEKYNNGRGK